MTYIQDLADFISASPSSYHAAAEIARRLRMAGFTELSEAEEWPPDPGDYFVVRDGAVIAWRWSGQPAPAAIVGTHTDSPGFKLKPKPTTSAHGFLQAGVEIYGGPLLESWLDRELILAGRLVTADGVHLTQTAPLLHIPRLAPHLGKVELDRQRHTNPVWGLGSSGDLLAALAEPAGIDPADILGYDILTVDGQPPAVFGAGDALFAAPRLDNLLCTHAGLRALLAGDGHACDGGDSEDGSASDSSGQIHSGADGDRPSADSGRAAGGIGGEAGRSHGAWDHIRMLAAFDHEEVGSATRSGAHGPFLSDVLTRLGLGPRELAGSVCVSADVGHSIHPNYPDKHDPVNHPVAGGGPILKINANQHYVTDAVGAAIWAQACERAGVPHQEFVSNNSAPCGSTIGPATATRLGIRTVDVGAPILAMHSARELCAVTDPEYLSAAFTSFLSRVSRAHH